MWLMQWYEKSGKEGGGGKSEEDAACGTQVKEKENQLCYRLDVEESGKGQILFLCLM
jgi:hypothetical protein